MKYFFTTIIIGFALGIVFQLKVGNNYYGCEHETQTDTIRITDTLYMSKNDTIMPKEMIISLNKVSIDTIKTLVNGNTVEEKFKIVIK